MCRICAGSEPSARTREPLWFSRAAVASKTGGQAADIRKEWVGGLIPGIPVMPSGVWAVGRAQEHDCGYCFV